MKTTAKLLMTLPLLASALFAPLGCETMEDHRVASGAGIGAATGALAGGIIGNQSHNRNAGIAIGAATGALIGAGTGAWLDSRAEKFKAVQDQNTQVTSVPAYVPPAPPANQPDYQAPPAVPEHITLRLNDTMMFTVGSSSISNEGGQKLNQIVGLLNENPNETVIIRGYASSEGGDALNVDLSQRRAEAVANYMIGQNVRNPSRIRTVGMGSSNPIATNDTEEGRRQNRRVEIEVFPPEGQQ